MGGNMKNRITGRSAFLALLKDEGITHLFGNPGTTELPIMHALKDHPDLTYVMAMQESLVVAIADGFSRASGGWSPATSMSRPVSAMRSARSTTPALPARR
jgi:thiamine pyrophosphate-dependent acetolactate synthase large subunit-like protein